MTQTSRRVSYILSSPSEPPPFLSLPPLGQTRKGRTAPLLVQKEQTPNGTSAFQSRNPFLDPPATPPPETASHPRHCLGVSALALDTSTLLANTSAPGGILYTGGRDGLVASWELGIPHKKRKGGRYDLAPLKQRVKWERIGDSAEIWDDEDDEANDFEEDAPEDEPSSSDEEMAEGWIGVNGKKLREVPYEDRWEVDKAELAKSNPPPTTFRQSAQTHTDWVNAMLLCNMNQTVITASADRTIRAWQPHSSEQCASPTMVGRHRDYVRCLAWARNPGLLFSGALDRSIAIWDINVGQPDHPIVSLQLNKNDDYDGVGAGVDRGSVYALGVDPAGSVLAAGTPERVVRLWDPRAGDESIGKLVGHSDCVRSIIVSEDGKYILTGSSDTTIKLWSLAAHRCLHTFNHHTSSVWSLFSSHPNLERFYSGSRDGHLAIVDLEQCTDIADGECVVLAREGEIPLKGETETKSGDEGIRAIVAMDDEYVWTSTGSSAVKRWRDVGRRISRLEFDGESYHQVYGESAAIPPQSGLAPPFQPLPNGPDVNVRNKRLSIEGTPAETQSLLFRTESRESRSVAFAPTPSPRNGPAEGYSSPQRGGESTSAGPSPLRDRLSAPQLRKTTLSGASIANSFMSDSSADGPDAPVVEAHSPTLNGIPYESLVCLGLPDSPYSFGFSAHHVRSHLSLQNTQGDPLKPEENGGALTHPSNNLSFDHSHPSKARMDFEDRELTAEAVPLRRQPDEIIAGRPGLIRSLILNDRQHVLTINTDGEVAVWNIVRATCVGRFSAADVAAALDLERGVKPSDDGSAGVRKHSQDVLELVRDRVEGETMIITWCMVDTKIGSLMVHLEEGRVFDAEVYSDELGLPADQVKEDTRLNLGKWTLANLFKGLIAAEKHEIETLTATPSSTASGRPPSLSRSPAPTHISLEPHRRAERRFSTTSLMSQGTPSLNIPGLATSAATPAILPDPLPVSPLLSTSAPASTPGWTSFATAMRTGPLSAIPQSPGSAAVSPVLPNAATQDYFSPRKRAESSPSRPEERAPQTPTLERSTSSAGVDKQEKKGMMRKFTGFGKKRDKESSMAPVVEKAEHAVEDTSNKAPDQHTIQLNLLASIRQHPFSPPSSVDAPPLAVPPSTQLLIAEESKDAGAWVVTYRSQVSSTERDMEALEMNSPGWLLDYLFTSRTKIKDPVKFTFILEPARDSGLAEMPEGTTRLSASRVLRARKVQMFIFDKLELGTARGRSSSIISLNSRIDPKPRKFSNPPPQATSAHAALDKLDVARPEDAVEILCGEEVVDSNMTLATLKHYYGSGGDMVLKYRLKKPFAPAQA